MKVALSFFLIVITVFACSSIELPTQDPSGLNLDFEEQFGSNTPSKWYVSRDGSYNASLDTEIVISGKKSLRIDFLKQAKEDAFGVGTSSLPVDDVRGKKITYVGYIRTRDLTSGYAGLWFRVDGTEQFQSLAFDNMGSRGVVGTTEWKQYKIELPVDSTATNINFGVLHTGKGTAWFDKLEILVDGKPYVRETFAASDEQLVWLKANAHPFQTAKAGSGFEDLAFMKNIVGDAEIVGLGEATHGTKEFFQMKHRITEYLASTKGFTIFAIEANMPEAYKINDYVLGGLGNVRDLMKGMYFWTWNTKEVEEMIEWMRAYNASGKGRIEFVGFDMQTGKVAMEHVVSFLKKHDPIQATLVQESYREIEKKIEASMSSYPKRETAPELVHKALEVITHIQLNAPKYAKGSSQQEVDWAVQNANVAFQSTSLSLSGDRYGFSYRDSCMAANIKWIKDHAAANSKLVLWAHNRHVWNMDGMMGGYLRKWYGDRYRIFGFKFHEGSYTAVGDKGISVYPSDPSYPGTLDWVFHSTGMPRFIVNLKNASLTDPRTNWLFKNLETKDIGAMATSGFAPERAIPSYDALIYFDSTSASECYGSTRSK